MTILVNYGPDLNSISVKYFWFISSPPVSYSEKGSYLFMFFETEIVVSFFPILINRMNLSRDIMP